MGISASKPWVVASDQMKDGPLVTVNDPEWVEFKRYVNDGGGGRMERQKALWLANAIIRLVEEYDREYVRWQRADSEATAATESEQV